MAIIQNLGGKVHKEIYSMFPNLCIFKEIHATGDYNKNRVFLRFAYLKYPKLILLFKLQMPELY